MTTGRLAMNVVGARHTTNPSVSLPRLSSSSARTPIGPRLLQLGTTVFGSVSARSPMNILLGLPLACTELLQCVDSRSAIGTKRHYWKSSLLLRGRLEALERRPLRVLYDLQKYIDLKKVNYLRKEINLKKINLKKLNLHYLCWKMDLGRILIHQPDH